MKTAGTLVLVLLGCACICIMALLVFGALIFFGILPPPLPGGRFVNVFIIWLLALSATIVLKETAGATESC